MKVACAKCYRESPEVEKLEDLDWVREHDGTRVCKRCRPEGHSGHEAKKAEQAAVAADLALMNTVPPTVEAKLARLAAIDRLRAKNVIR